MASYPSLRDRVVVVTGGASGIGEAIVEAFAMQGSRVAFLDIQDAAADQLVRKIEAAGLHSACLLPLRPDATSRQSKHLIEDILQRFNTVDVLVNNAGNDTRHSIRRSNSRILGPGDGR